MRTIGRFLVLLLCVLPPACGSGVRPRVASKDTGKRFWTLMSVDAPPARVEELWAILDRCADGLGDYFPDVPGPLRVLAYGDRATFVEGLQAELGFSEETAGYFAQGGAPRPLQGKMLVPPDQRPVNVCHELVHHYLESHTRRDHLLAAKWFDEGIASHLAARIFEAERLRHADVRLIHMAEGVLLPLDEIEREEDWRMLHRVPSLRSIAYSQAQSMAGRLIDVVGPEKFRELLRRGREIPLQGAIAEVTGKPVGDFYRAWKEGLAGDGVVRLFDEGDERPGFLTRATPGEVGLDAAAIRTLVREALKTRTDALLLIKDGRIVVERNLAAPGERYETMSVTKSVVSLAVGLLIADGKIASVDAPVSTWFEDWSRGRKAEVTLRHILTHSSGLAHHRGAGTMNRHDDRTAYARGRPVIGEPGSRFSYNNEATQLLSDIVRKAAGQDLDAYLDEKLFRPLGIRGFDWERDRAGNVQTFYGLSLEPRDLARIGLLMLTKGRHEGQELVPAAWVRDATRPGLPAFPMMGYLWWLRHQGHTWTQTGARLDRLQREGLGVAPKLRPLSGKKFERPEAYWLAAGALLSDAERIQLLHWTESHESPLVRVPKDPIGFNANGWQGQYLAVYPGWRLVAVRMRRPLAYDEDENKRFGMGSFFELVEATVTSGRDR